MKVSEVMTLGTASVRESDTLLKAIELLVDHRISALPVTDDDAKPVGILTEGDMLRQSGFHLVQLLAKSAPARRSELDIWLVREVMTHDCITIGADTPLEDAVERMDRDGLKRLPVVADGKLVGMLSRSDLLRALVRES